MTDQDFIRKTFELARAGLGKTWPNPLVGAVIVKNGKIIGSGHHAQYGKDHAEVAAFKNCSESPEGATLYVNLEPCCHTNKQTPPCAQRVIAEKIKKVVICNLDPHAEVNGQGVALLKASGIEVEHGVLADEGEILNEVFFLNQRAKRPFIHFKMATTLDGKCAMLSGESQWITGEKARHSVHEMRSHHQAIIVGAGTVRKDNPKLTVRLPNYEGEQPWRVVITKSGLLPQHAHLFTDEFKDRTLVYSDKKLSDILADLYQKKIVNLMLEGGPTLAASFMQEGFIDRVSLYLNPSFLGNGFGAIGDFGLSTLAKRPTLKNLQTSWYGEDLFITGQVRKD